MPVLWVLAAIAPQDGACAHRGIYAQWGTPALTCSTCRSTPVGIDAALRRDCMKTASRSGDRSYSTGARPH